MKINLAKRMRAARLAKKMSQRELAGILGIDHARVSELENGKVTSPRLPLLLQIAKALGISVDRLLH